MKKEAAKKAKTRKGLLIALVALIGACCFAFASCGGTGDNGASEQSSQSSQSSQQDNDQDENSSQGGQQGGQDDTPVVSGYSVSTYSNTAEYGNAGTYTELKNEKKEAGETVTLTATVNDGYNFEGWYIGKVCLSKNLEYTFTVEQANASIEARFSSYTLTVQSSSNKYAQAGEYTEIKGQKVSVGETVSMTATVKDGYNFDGWYIGKVCVSEDLEYIHTMKAENTVIEAVYSYYTFTTYGTNTDGGKAGTYSAYDGQKISVGKTVTLTATVNEGYNFEGWYINGECACEELSYTHTMSAMNAEIEAVYSYYTITAYSYTDDGGYAGTHSTYDAQKISVGKDVTLTATVNDGYNFEGWYLINDWEETLLTAELTYTLKMGAENVEAEARYSYYTVTTESGSDEYGNAGIYTEYNVEKISLGEVVTLTATVNDGYNFVGWFVNNGDLCVETGLSYTFTMSRENVWIEARYNYYTVTTWSDSDDYGMAGTYTEYNEEKISIGEEVTLTATVDNGYTFEGWYTYYGDICLSEGLTYTFTMGAENEEIEAKYTYYTVTTRCDTDEYGMAGTYTEYDDEKVTLGETVTLTATVNDGYNFEGWYIYDVCVSTDLEYSFTMEDNITIWAEYSCYTLETDACRWYWNYTTGAFYPIMGSYDNYDAEKITAGTEITLTATVNSGYVFLGWFIGGTKVSEGMTYTFIMPKNDVEVVARFEPIEE